MAAVVGPEEPHIHLVRTATPNRRNTKPCQEQTQEAPPQVRSKDPVGRGGGHPDRRRHSSPANPQGSG